MKYCTHCGNQLVDEAVICPKCGCAAENVMNGGNGYRPANTNSLSILSIVGFVFAFLEPIVGLICSIIAYRSAVDSRDERSKNFSRTGIIISAVFLGIVVFAAVICLLLFVLGVFTAGYYPYY